jgi:hypothetical protein
MSLAPPGHGEASASSVFSTHSDGTPSALYFSSHSFHLFRVVSDIGLFSS